MQINPMSCRGGIGVVAPLPTRSRIIRWCAPEVIVPMKAPAPGNRLPYRRGSVEYCLGTEADHEAVYQTLLHVFHGPDRESFLGALSDPAYRPDSRLLAKVDAKVVSHVHLTDRTMRYGSATMPINGVMWVG